MTHHASSVSRADTGLPLGGSNLSGRSRRLILSPSSLYPNPTAYVIDDVGTILHSWSHSADQLRPAENPPKYLRGWNHVEADGAGNLLAIVPLRSLIKLSPASELAWRCEVAAHHDIAVRGDGTVLVLTEAPRSVNSDGQLHVVLDNLVSTVNTDGAAGVEYSLFDILRSDPDLRQLIDSTIQQRRAGFRTRGWPTSDDDVASNEVRETQGLLQATNFAGERRRTLQLLRALPGRPCDVLHANTLELTSRHPDGLWDNGNALVCMRELDTIAVVDLDRMLVRWWWGPGNLSGPHQPTLLPDGRVLVFDNGVKVGRTRLLIVEPRTREVVWSWSADPPESFFCPLAGGCEQLANGNLLVTNPRGGAAFELTMEGEIVWRLTLPINIFDAGRDRVSIYRMATTSFNPGGPK